jgi:hypothetical protein
MPIVLIKNVLLVILIALLVLVLRALSVFLVMKDFSLKLTLVEHHVLQVFGKMFQLETVECVTSTLVKHAKTQQATVFLV